MNILQLISDKDRLSFSQNLSIQRNYLGAVSYTHLHSRRCIVPNDGQNVD